MVTVLKKKVALELYSSLQLFEAGKHPVGRPGISQALSEVLSKEPGVFRIELATEGELGPRRTTELGIKTIFCKLNIIYIK